MALMGLSRDPRVVIILPSHRPYENALHHVVKDFVAGGYDYWLNIDADNPPIKNPLDLIALDKDILGLPTPVWHWTGVNDDRPIYWNAYSWDEKAQAFREYLPQDGLRRVDAVGTGCMLVARRVFKDPKMLVAPFQRSLAPDGTVDVGNDLAFCRRATRCGFEVWAHFDYPCRHYQEVELTEVIQAHQKG